ncbi:DUF5956 family protein [Microbacterium sp. MC2]
MSTVPPHPGDVVVLGPHLQHSLVAYLAGPRHVQRVPRQHGDVRVQINDGPQFARPADDEDRAEIQDALESYMTDLGLPPPPSEDEWRLYLPENVTEEDLWAAVNSPEVVPYTDTNGREVAAQIRDQLARLLGPLD